MIKSIPRVSIGLIVYNGENYLAQAIDSILAQTFTDFELIISDNASSDGTEQICRDYAKKDPRIRYYRADHNHGATWNHNYVIELARGAFFKLAAHDDVCEPGFIEACVDALDENPEAVLAFTDAKLVRDDFWGNQRLHKHTQRTDLASASLRFTDMIADFQGFQVFGCIRTEVLRRIKPFGPWKASDRLFIAELSLQGTFARVEEYLFVYRLHAQQSIGMVNKPEQYQSWWTGNGATASRIYPHWRFLRELIGMVNRAPLSVAERFRCYRKVVSWVNLNSESLWQELVHSQPQSNRGQ